MRIGDTIQAGLNTVDYSPYLQAQQRATSVIGDSIAQGVGAVGDAIKDRREKKDKIKVSKELTKALSTLYPESAGAVAPIIESLDDEELPLSQRAALGEQIGTLINMGVEKNRNDALLALDERRVAIGERGLAIEEGVAQREASLVEKAMADQEALTGFMARPALEQALRETVAAEQRGETPLIGSEKLKLAFLKQPDEQMQIVAAAMQGLPKAAPLEFRDIEFTRDGQPAKGTAVFDPRKGQFSLVPVADPTAAATPLTGLPEPLAPYASTFEEAGRKYGVDPKVLAAISMHETANGTSSAFRNKNNAMGISDASGPVAMESVEASIDRMARLLGSTQSGPYKNAATIQEIAGVYAPVGAGNDPRGLNQYWTKGVASNLSRLGGDPSAPVRIQPGAARAGTVKTPTEQALDETKLKLAEQELKGAESAVAKEQATKQASLANAEDAVKLIETLKTHPGFEAAVGSGFSKTVLRQDEPIRGTDRAGAVAIIDQLKGQAFLNAIQQLRGLGALSDAEGAKLQQAAARLDPNQSEKDFNAALDEYKAMIQAGIERAKAGQLAPGVQPPAAQSAADRLRALKR